MQPLKYVWIWAKLNAAHNLHSHSVIIDTEKDYALSKKIICNLPSCTNLECNISAVKW